MKKIMVIISFFTIGIYGCEDSLEIVQAPSNPEIIRSSLPIMADPNPGSRGPYAFCSNPYQSKSPNVAGMLYVPVTNRQHCKVSGDFPLVLIAHADGVNADYASYEALGQHLASHGMVVASMDRFGLGADEAFDDLLIDQLDYLYSISSVRNIITDRVGLIGHSAGGRAVIKFAGIINDYGKQLNSLIVLAPTIDPEIDYTFNNKTTAFLGLHVTYDSDVMAFGNKSKDKVMRSTFKIYDDAGLTKGDPNSLSLTKDMVFANTGNHYFQNHQFALTYINAFLQIHLKGNAVYQRFFKFQEKPAGLLTRVFLQHADPLKLVVADFENKDSDQFNKLGGNVLVTGGGITNFETGFAYKMDDYSPHHSKVIKFDWNKSLPIAGYSFGGINQSGQISFDIPKGNDISNYKYLSFRASQVYHDENNPDGIARDFDIVLRDDKVKTKASIAEHGGLLHFPVIVVAPVGAIQEEQTKNAMRSYIIPLDAFKDINLKTLNRLTFDFTPAGQSSTTFILDDIEFYQ